MKKLEKKEYEKLIPLVKGSQRQLSFVYSVLEGNQDGEVFADNCTTPNIALVHFGLGLLYIIANGNSSDNIKKMCNWIINDFHTKAPSLILLSPIPSIQNEIKESLKNKVIESTRISFTFSKDKFLSNLNWNNKIPKGLVMKSIDKEIVFKVFEKQRPSIKMFWRTAEKFLKNGFGFVILDKDEIASIAYSACIGNKMVEIDIYTYEKYRGRGLSLLTSSALIEYCINNGYKPNWDCDKKNIASIKIANKLGYTKFDEYSLLVWKNEVRVF